MTVEKAERSRERVAPIRVLIIEDDPAAVARMGEVLRDDGFEVESAPSPREGFFRLANRRFDAAVIDGLLLETEGFRFLERLEAEHIPVPVVLLAGVVNVDLISRAMREGATDFLDRRFCDTDLLIRKISSAVEHHRLRANLLEQKRKFVEERERQKVNRLKTEFLANTSHELRTPLNAILGYADLLIDELTGKVDEEYLQFIRRVEASGRRLLDLVNAMLDFAAMLSGTDEPRIEEVRVPDAIEHVVSIVRPKAATRGIAIAVHVEDDAEIVFLDGPKLRQILYNLLDNAVKFSRKEGGTVTIRVRREGKEAQLSVQDQGIGIQAEDRERIFEPFEMADGSTTRRFEGAGLGLPIARELTTRMRGRIWAESEPDRGSTFFVRVPEMRVE